MAVRGALLGKVTWIMDGPKDFVRLRLSLVVCSWRLCHRICDQRISTCPVSILTNHL